MNNESTRPFLLGFFSIFKITKVILRKKHEVDLLEYFIKIEQDIKNTFQEIKREYERK